MGGGLGEEVLWSAAELRATRKSQFRAKNCVAFGKHLEMAAKKSVVTRIFSQGPGNRTLHTRTVYLTSRTPETKSGMSKPCAEKKASTSLRYVRGHM